MKLTKPFSITRRGLIVGASACAYAALSARHVMAQKTSPIRLENYQRVFFNAEEWAFVLAAVARFIPSGGNGPSGLDVGVPIYIDKQMVTAWGQGQHWYMEGPFVYDAPHYTGYQSGHSPAETYRIAIPVINNWCKTNYGKIFAQLTEEQQDAVLTSVQKDEVPINDLMSGDFFSIFLQNSKEGYLSDPQYGGNYDMAAWVYIGFPGARASFLEWVEKDNITYRLGPVSINGERA